MKNKLSFFFLHILLLLFITSGAHAQDIPAGYYRVKSVGLESNGGKIYKNIVKEDCYAYVANGTYHVKTSAGAGQNIPSMLLWAGLDNAIVSPQTVVYIVKSGSNYNIEAQGTSLSQMTSYKINVTQITSDTYTLSTTISGIMAYLEAQVQKSGIYDKEGNDAYPSNYIATTVPQGSEVYKRWQLVPISSSSDNYVAVNAFLEAEGKYYAPYFASYPFKFVSPGMKAYYVSSISKSRYTLKEITSEVIPAKTPVIVECSSNNPADCKIEPLYGNYGSVSGNRLDGVYYCNLEMSPTEYPDCRTKFDPSSMRVWAVKNGQLVLTNSPDKSRLAIPYDVPEEAWLMANESYLYGVPSTAAADLLPAGAATTITFDSAGGTEVESISGVEGDPVVAPENPTKTGYSFIGWNPELPSEFPATDMSVTAQWQINKYTITFDTDGGTTIAPITQDYQSAITAPANPTKTGYTFAGWDKTIPDLMPAEDMTVKALWTIGKYTITFDTDGGTTVLPITQDYNTQVTAPENPTKTGYTFMGWDQEIPTSMPGSNVTIKAKWKINQYTITFDTDGGTEVLPITQDYNTTITKPENPTKTGYKFDGWNKEIPSTMPAENVTVKALWTIGRYTITFDTDGGTEIRPITQDYNTPVTVPDDPTRTGYVFAGWDKDVPTLMPGEDVTVKALWNKLYTLSYDTDGGSEILSVTAVIGTPIVVPADPIKTGYTFKGWDPSVPSYMPEDNLVCKAIWQINKYKVTFKLSDGTIVSEKVLDYGSAIEVPTITESSFKGWTPTPDATVPDHDVVYVGTFDKNTITFDTDGGEPIPASIIEVYGTDISERTKNIQDPKKLGYTFIGWDKEIPSVMPDENMTVKALWQINQYTITFDTDGGTAVAPITQDYNSVVTAPEAPTKTGYKFDGWDKEIPPVMPAENVTIKALWKINQYTITFDTDGGTAVAPVTQDYQSKVTAPEAPTKTGYTFDGWDKEIPSTMPAENVTIKALWKINQYTITFDTDGGTAVAPITQDYQSTVTAPEAPTKKGYTFVRWENLPSSMPAEEVTIKAIWQINKYTVTFDTDGGSDVASITQDYDTPVLAPSNPTKEGYTFIGWDKEIPSKMPAEDVAVKAQWQINEYTLTYYVDGEVYKSEKLEYNSHVTAEKEPSKTGYSFSGWNEEIPTVMPASDVTITGSFTIRQYTISFETNGGSTVAPITQDYQSVITAPDDPVKEGYDFAGWSPAIPETMPASNMMLTALWGPKKVEETYLLNEGWTWLSFIMINKEMRDLNTLLSSLKWTSSDEIKGASLWGIYSVKKSQWIGDLAGFNDLTMYKIHSSYADQKLILEGSYQNSKGDKMLTINNGWNYLAYLSLDAMSVDEALQNYDAAEGDVLKSQTASATYSNGEWKGTLTTMEPRKGYMLYRNADNTVDFCYPVISASSLSNDARAASFEDTAQPFSSNMTVFATVDGIMSVPGDSIVAVAVDGVRGSGSIDNEGRACITILGDNKADVYLTLLHNNEIVATANAPIKYVSDDIVGSYANPTSILFTEGTEAWSSDYNVTAIYSMDGKCLPTIDVKTLSTGLYIIKYEVLSNNNGSSSGCRVIRVVQ